MTRSVAILDTNIYISYLLAIQPDSAVVALVQAAFDDAFQPALPLEQLRELKNAVDSKQYLRDRIPQELLAGFIERLMTIAVVPEPLIGEVRRIFRDPLDDYLYAYAVRDGFEIIVSGDRDVLAERERFTQPEILTSLEFAARIARR